MATKHDIVNEFKEEYWRADKKEKTRILNHVEAVTKMNRKALVRRFGILQKRQPFWKDNRGSPVRYGVDVTAALREVWIVNNEKYCGKLLKFNKGASMSDHFHLVKDETWYVLEGKLELRHYNLANADRIVKTISNS